MNWLGYYYKPMYDDYLCGRLSWTQLAGRYGRLSVIWFWRADQTVQWMERE